MFNTREKPLNKVPISGWFVNAYDGDTITVRLCARIVGIDAPEKGQAGFAAAKEDLENFIWRSGEFRPGPIHLTLYGVDKYGRLLVDLIHKQENYAPWSLRQGLSWATEYCYSALETAARKARVGLWKLKKKPIPPWEFRSKKSL